MSNPRDTGRYDVFTDSYVDQQVRVDFAWGNIPMQPNDDRGEATLDPALDSHEIATGGYQGFPSFIQGGIYDDTIENKVVPNVVGLTEAAATTALTNAGLVKGAVTTANNAAGATALNNNLVKTQTPAAGTTVNTGASVALVKYAYVNPSNPILAMKYGMDMMLMTSVASIVIPGQVVKPTVGDRISVTAHSYSGFNITWSVLSVENDNAYTTGSTLVKAIPTVPGGDFMTAPGTYVAGGAWITVPRSNPSSVTFTGGSSDTSIATFASVGNAGVDRSGNAFIRIPSTTQAYDDIQYGVQLPASNGWAGKTVTLNVSPNNPGAPSVSGINGLRTVQTSSLVAAAGETPAYILLIFTENIEIAMRMSTVAVNGTMAINS